MQTHTPTAPLPSAGNAPALLQTLMEFESYRQQRASHVLRTPEAMRWFVRQHQLDLVADGALLKISNRWTVHADRFDSSILRIGQEMAQKRSRSA